MQIYDLNTNFLDKIGLERFKLMNDGKRRFSSKLLAYSKGRVIMLSQFNNQVLSYGPAAVLPQNLNSTWLEKLQKAADEFLDGNFDLHECKDPRDVGDPLLMACVYEIVAYQTGATGGLSIDDMAEKLTVYSLSIIMEAVHREQDIGLEAPDLNNILSMERIITFKRKNPDFVEFLKNVCIVRNSEKGWFRNLKEKLINS
jgi:hypothetical protein